MIRLFDILKWIRHLMYVFYLFQILFLQSFRNHIKTFHKHFPEIAETEDLTNGEYDVRSLSPFISQVNL